MKEKTKEFMKKNFKWLVLFIALIGFLALAEDVFNKEIMNGDIIGYKIISTFLISDFATPIAKFITNFGGAIFLITLTVILFPTEFRIIEETGYSFPSGHSMVSMAFYGYLIYLIYKYVKNKYVKWILIALLSILICTIGVSRIYLGVHYTSDVLGGFLVSISYLILFISTVNKFFIEKD